MESPKCYVAHSKGKEGTAGQLSSYLSEKGVCLYVPDDFKDVNSKCIYFFADSLVELISYYSQHAVSISLWSSNEEKARKTLTELLSNADLENVYQKVAVEPVQEGRDEWLSRIDRKAQEWGARMRKKYPKE